VQDWSEREPTEEETLFAAVSLALDRSAAPIAPASASASRWSHAARREGLRVPLPAPGRSGARR
jgi:hypothetical protein